MAKVIKYQKKVGGIYYYKWHNLEITTIPSGAHKGDMYEFGVSLYLDKERIGNFVIRHDNKNKVSDSKLDRNILHYLPNVIIDTFENES